MRGRASVWTLMLATGAGLIPAPSTAQLSNCPYADCALRVHFGVLGGQSLVRSSTGEQITGLGFPVDNLDDAFAGSPMSQALARTFRRRQNAGTVLAFAGGLMIGVWFLQKDSSSGPDDFLIWGGLAIGLGGTLTAASGRDYLSRAVWEYNRGLGR